jgi:hypothetical protein
MELERILISLRHLPPPAPFVLGAESYENMGRLTLRDIISARGLWTGRDEGECLFCVNILESK